jgi:uncharacterized protein YndB with AHSA1/START domain
VTPRAPPGDAASASVHVRVTQADAFDVFTREIDRWWRHGAKFRVGGKRAGQLFFECRLGGRLFETFELSKGTHTQEVGRVVAWDAPRRFALEWRGANFKPHEKTLVEVTFEPAGEGTLVTVRHSGWSALPEEHPARHGLAGPALSRFVGLWWGELMAALREHVATTRPEPAA